MWCSKSVVFAETVNGQDFAGGRARVAETANKTGALGSRQRTWDDNDSFPMLF
jgi:hypothetical protein